MRYFKSLAQVRHARWEHMTKIHEVTKQYANLPESYIKDVIEREIFRNPKGKCYRKISHYEPLPDTGRVRPWSIEAMERFYQKDKRDKPRYVEPLENWHFFSGDRVEVLTGRDKGKQGIISNVIPEKNWVFVKGLNMKLEKVEKRYTLEEAPLLVPTQVALVDPGDLQPTKAEYAVTEEGEVVRRSARTGRLLPYSKLKYQTYDYKTKQTYRESPKDTREDGLKATFIPKLKTFEMDIAEEHGIEESRMPAKTYWY